MKLESSRKIALEAESTAIETMTNLRGQRETIKRASMGVQGISSNLTKSNKIITTMTRRAIANKIVMLIVIILILAAIGIVIYVKVS